MSGKNKSFDIESTTAMPILQVDARELMGGDYRGDTSIMRMDLERLNAAGEWLAVDQSASSNDHAEQALNKVLRNQVLAAQSELAELRSTYDALQDKHAKRIIAHEKLRARHEGMVIRQDELARLLITTKLSATNNMKHVARLLLRIKQQQAQILALEAKQQ